MITFKQFNFSNELHKSIDKLGFEFPTQIQEKSIPLIIQGKDILGKSETGSGKTLAFGCGVIENTVPGKGLQALVLTPTRELAEQVKNALVELGNSKRLKIISIYGGVAINPQFDQLQTAEVVIATPGRFLDHLDRGTVNTSKIITVVLDEADRMLDMGFIEDIETILNSLPKKRQTMFFSATIPPAIERLCNKYLHDYEKVFAGNQVDPSKLKQVYYDINKNMKISLLIHLIKNETSELVMVFCNSRKTTDIVVTNLKLNGVKAIALHGGFSQNKRSKSIDLFKDEKIRVLVCTDVAARGLDIYNVSHVYNYEIPNDPTDYVHRIGRTARAGEAGIVINLICEYDHDNFSRLVNEYRDFTITKMQKPFIEQVRVKIDRAPRGGFGSFRNQSSGNRGYGNRRSDNGRSRSRERNEISYN